MIGTVESREHPDSFEPPSNQPFAESRQAGPSRSFRFQEGACSMSTASLQATSAAKALRQSPIPALRRLHVEESGTAVRISGSVASYYLKQLAQETVMAVLDRRQLLNQVTVVRS
jgi:hypothetical protein